MLQRPRAGGTIFLHSLCSLFAHCSLSYSSGPDSSNLPKSNRFASGAKNSAIVHIPTNRLEVTVHKDYEEYSMSQMNRYPSSDAQLFDKTPHELGLDDNVEGRDEKE
jgi:hypothetical protein